MTDEGAEVREDIKMGTGKTRDLASLNLLVTHARSLEELRQEFVSDLSRRISGLRMESKLETRSRQSLGLGRAISEIEALIQYWQTVELAGSRRREQADVKGR